MKSHQPSSFVLSGAAGKGLATGRPSHGDLPVGQVRRSSYPPGPLHPLRHPVINFSVVRGDGHGDLLEGTLPRFLPRPLQPVPTACLTADGARRTEQLTTSGASQRGAVLIRPAVPDKKTQTIHENDPLSDDDLSVIYGVDRAFDPNHRPLVSLTRESLVCHDTATRRRRLPQTPRVFPSLLNHLPQLHSRTLCIRIAIMGITRRPHTGIRYNRMHLVVLQMLTC